MLLYETRGTAKFYYSYDANGVLYSVSYTSNDSAVPEVYYYTHNMFGDIIGIYDNSGSLVAQYEYDSWGNIVSIKNAGGGAITKADHIANLNPFRYRGYYYDTESGLYYLMSRYYDPVTHRFINADGYFQAGDGILDANMHAYCGNNPIMCFDPTGTITLYQLQCELAKNPDTCGYNIDLITNYQRLGYNSNDEVPFFYPGGKVSILYGSVKETNYKGWNWRIDNNKYSKTHIHIFKGNKEYSQNIDGSPHDGSTGSPPNSVKKYLKEQNIWDWDAKKESYDFTQNELSQNLEMMQLLSEYHFSGVPLDVGFTPFTFPQFSSSFSGYSFYYSSYGYIL